MTDPNQAEAQLYNHTNQLLQSHETLLSDRNRNRSFYRALKSSVTKESSVLDIGAGTGIWTIAAAKLGAKRVVAIEQDPLLIGLIKKVAKDNGVADRIEVIEGDSRQVRLAREFDLVISETIGYLIFDESIVPIMIDARARFLKSGGILIPESVRLVAACAHLENRHKTLPAGIPIVEEYFESLALNIPIGLPNRARLRIITSPQELIQVDLGTIKALPKLENLTARWERVDTKQVNCFVVWGEALLAPGVAIATRKTSSWSPMIYRIRPSTQEQSDIELKLTLTTKTNYWTATFTCDAAQEVQSYSPAFAAAELLARTRTDAHVFSHGQYSTNLSFAK